DFLEDKRPRGVDVLARALAALDVKEAAPLIAAHLGDHETPERALKDLVVTLGQLGGAQAAVALREFLLQYHADPGVAGDPEPLGAAGEALIPAGVEARRTVAFVADDKRTLAPLARQLRVGLDAAAAAEKEKSDKADQVEAAPERQE